MLTHCGIREIELDGRTWVATRPRPVKLLVQPGGAVDVDGYTSGTWTTLGPDRARFDVNDPAVAPVPGGVEFRALTTAEAAQPRAMCG